ncbi:hypothetical protein [Rhizobium populisoli]|uniref:hypothetical protein n=1 Tax=Rhizobium populisoli TaxID=2859785 RepID=UPI001FE6E146|nr:hypothetical protein [Rhizobium populisoli]
MIVRPIKSLAFVNVQTPAINHLLDFDTVKDHIIESLHVLERLRVFAMDESVRRLILAAIQISLDYFVRQIKTETGAR